MNTNQKAAHAAFMAEASKLSEKLTFNTRSEYFAWVKQWKEDYNNVLAEYTRNKFCGRQQMCIRPEKIEYYKKKLAALPKLTGEQKLRLEEIKREYITINGYSAMNLSWVSMYSVLRHMYLIRKASKLRAGKKREERLALEASLVK